MTQKWQDAGRWQEKPGRKLKHGEPTTVLSARIPLSLMERLEKYSKANGKNKAEIMVTALEGLI
jgi:hypothetical protein